jgi:DNA-binding beta-propeller fold protein YncE
MKLFISTALLAFSAFVAFGQTSYKVTKTVKVGGDGGYDYVYADVDGRRLYIPRPGQTGARITVYNLDTLEPVGEIPNANARGAAVDPKSHHGFVSSKPVVMFDSKTLAVIKTIDVQGNPDGIMFDPFNQRVWIFSHAAPNATVINTQDGSIAGTVDLGGAPEQAVADGQGHIWVDVEDKDSIAAVDARTLAVTAQFDLKGKCGGPGGLGLDAKNHILFATCHEPATMAIVSADSGKLITSLPIGSGTDGGGFDPNTMEAFSSNGEGTLSVIKENSPTDFVVEQTVKTMPRARTMTVDTKTNQVVLIGAEFTPPPTPPPAGGRPGRGQMVPGSFTILVVGK